MTPTRVVPTRKPPRHTIDEYPGSWMHRHGARAIRTEPPCPCGTTERHEHCSHCGALISVGDWDAAPIATYTLRVCRGYLPNLPPKRIR